MSAINSFLRGHGHTVRRNPCVSPDFCLDWNALRAKLAAGGEGGLLRYAKSAFSTAAGQWRLVEDRETGDCAWHLTGTASATDPLDDALITQRDGAYFPATWTNLLRLKNQIQESEPASTIFPNAEGSLGRRTLGIGARFTALHWPAVEWAMSALNFGVTANQNSIPRELVYDVDAMLEGRLAKVPFPFIGTSVPEGHQGQSVEGMSHGAVLSKLMTGFHRRRVAWSFNADHQPIGGAFDSREDALVRGSLLASYITFDLSPELAKKTPASPTSLDQELVAKVRARVRAAGLTLAEGPFLELMCVVWPAMRKMKLRDQKYRSAREKAFSTAVGRKYLRELSIDELPGLTTPETTAVMLALCEALEMPVNFIAPAFGFQKNIPYPDNSRLTDLIRRQWDVAKSFGVSIGFHSGSGKSAENYGVMGQVTGGCLEIKTSGRYTYEMGVALAASRDPSDRKLWLDWHRFTVELASAGAFSADETERNLARSFIADTLARAGAAADVFASPAQCHAALAALPPSPDHVFFFEYNFLYVLAANGRADKAALGDHSEAGYAQRARFYAISDEARLLYAKRVAGYILFLAESTGLVPKEKCESARAVLDRIESYSGFIDSISP
ncbi:MAG TPA: tagaturonate epimerase family protein [Opitutaceae bacterium]|jgi:hypothetical protein